MRKLILSISIIFFTSPLFASQNDCLNHIEEHLHRVISSYNLYLQNCQLQDTDMVALNEVLKTYNIGELNLDNNSIDDKGIETLNGQDDVHKISINNNPIGDNGLKQLLSKIPYLYSLSVEGDNITNESVSSLAQSSIYDLDLANNQITDASSLFFIESLNVSFNPLNKTGLLELTKNAAGRDLFLEGIHLDDDLLKNLSNNKRIKRLDVSESGLGDSGIQILSNNSFLQTLYADKDQISDTGLKAISKMKALSALSLIGNNITISGFKYLPPPRLYEFDLSDNHLGDEGVENLTFGRLSFLYLNNNQITAKGAAYLATAPRELAFLWINDNQLGAAGAKALLQHAFDCLDIDNNNIGNEGAVIVASKVGYKISMANNGIDDNGVLNFEPLLSKTVNRLDVRKNHITSVGKEKLLNHQPKINLYIDDSDMRVKKLLLSGHMR